jgi:ParB/RepB/Spo0J family partition protein
MTSSQEINTMPLMPKTRDQHQPDASATPVAAKHQPPQAIMAPLSDLVPTPDNPRFIAPAAELASLAASIREHGVLQPVVARPHPTLADKLDLRCGHRRLRAAEMAGLDKIPCIVRDLDDIQAMEITVCENLHREDLHPLEESRGVRALLERAGWDHEAIAAHLGKSASWVARRARLCHLANSWERVLLDQTSVFSSWSAGHLELIARLPEESQDEVLNYLEDDHFAFDGKVPTVADLDGYLDMYLRKLGDVRWALDDDTLVPDAGACSTCQKRSGCQPLLFEVDADNDMKAADRCLDPSCFERKGVAIVVRRQAELQEKHTDLVLVSGGGGYYVDDEVAAALGAKPLNAWDYKTCKKNAPGARPAMVVSGPKAGKLEWITPHGRAAGKVSAASGVPKTLAERRQILDKRRQAHVVTAVVEELKQLTPLLLHQLIRDSPFKLTDVASVMNLVYVFGTEQRADYVEYGGVDDENAWKLFDRAAHTDDTPAKLLHSVVQVWLLRLNFGNNDRIDRQAADAKHMCDLPWVGMDYAALERDAVKAIPEPASWANLNKDGTPKVAKKKKPAKAADPAPDNKASVPTKGKKAKAKKKAKPQAV